MCSVVSQQMVRLTIELLLCLTCMYFYVSIDGETNNKFTCMCFFMYQQMVRLTSRLL